MTDFEKLLDKRLSNIETQVTQLRIELAVHKVKAGLLGAIAGALVALAAKVPVVLAWIGGK